MGQAVRTFQQDDCINVFYSISNIVMFKRKKQQSIIPKQVEMLWSQKIRGRRRIFRREEQKGIVDFCRLQWPRKVRYRFPVTSSLEYAYRKTSQNVFLMWDKFFFKKLRGSLTGSPYLKALMFLYAFEESVDCHLLSYFCDDSNLHISLFKYVLYTMGVSKESILRMRNFTWNRFPIKNLLIDSLLTPIV